MGVKMNPKKLRLDLGSTPTEAGIALLGHKDTKKAYDIWRTMEATGKTTSGQETAFIIYGKMLNHPQTRQIFKAIVKKRLEL